MNYIQWVSVNSIIFTLLMGVLVQFLIATFEDWNSQRRYRKYLEERRKLEADELEVIDLEELLDNMED